MWTYEQSTGRLSREGAVVAEGYSGLDAGKNNPEMQEVHDVGPLPRGIYVIGRPHDTETHGPFVLPLTPDPANTMFGRTGFLIHGDSLQHPGRASNGCIILPRPIRDRIAASGDDQLTVVA
jgi:hypothetical protein